jgi:hypothetical protein
MIPGRVSCPEGMTNENGRARDPQRDRIGPTYGARADPAGPRMPGRTGPEGSGRSGRDGRRDGGENRTDTGFAAIRGRLKGLVAGHDSDGPLLATRTADSGSPVEFSRFSFVDPTTLKVLKVGVLTNGNSMGSGNVSPAGGSIQLNSSGKDRVHVRTSANGDLFGIWRTYGSPSGFQTLTMHRANLKSN